MALKPGQYINQRRRLEELEQQIPDLLAKIYGLGEVVTYLVDQLGGQVTIDRASLQEMSLTKTVSSDSNPDDETLRLFIEEDKTDV